MYSASQREVGEYSNRMRLEVGIEFLSSYPEGQCRLLETGISGFYLVQGLACKEYGPLFLVFVFFE